MPLPILLSGLICISGSVPAWGQDTLNELGTALEAGELNWVASPADAWRAVSSSSAKVNRDLVACFEAEAFGPDDDDFPFRRLRTTVTGPAAVSFWWKVTVPDSEEEFDFAIDDTVVLQLEERSTPTWEQIHVGVPAGEHTFRFSVSSGEFLLDGFEVRPGEVLPIAAALGDSDGVWVQEGGTWEVVDAGGPFGQPSVVSTLGGDENADTVDSARLVRLLPADTSSLLRFWVRTQGTNDWNWVYPAGGRLTTEGVWERRIARVGDSRFTPVGAGEILEFHHIRNDREGGESQVALSGVSLQSIAPEEALDTGRLEGEGSVQLSVNDPAGRLFISDGQDLAGNGAVAFVGEVANSSATASSIWSGPGLLTFSWRVPANLGASLTLRANGAQLFRTTGGGSSGFVQEAIRLPDAAGQMLEWEMQFAANPWNPILLDAILFSTNAAPALVAALGLAPETPLYLSAPSGAEAVVAQNAVAHDGDNAVAIDAGPAAAGNAGGRHERRALTFPVTGPALVTFWQRSALPLEASLVTFIAGNRVAQVDGSAEWSETTVFVPAGEQMLRWELIANDAVLAAGHAAWLDDVEILPSSGTVEDALEAELLSWSRDGVAVFQSAAASADGADAVVLSGDSGHAASGWVEAVIEGPGTFHYQARGTQRNGIGTDAVAKLTFDGIQIHGGSIGQDWAIHELIVPPDDHTLRIAATRHAELWLDQFSFTPAHDTMVDAALDAPGRVFKEGTEAAGGGKWVALGDFTGRDGRDDMLMLNAYPFANRTADLRTEVIGPARVSFDYRGGVQVVPGDRPDAQRLFLFSRDEWSTHHLIVPEGTHQIGWIAGGNNVRSSLDALVITPLAGHETPGTALDTGADRQWTASGNAPWEIVTEPSETFDGIDALQSTVVPGGQNIGSALSTTVEGPALVRFAARASGVDSEHHEWVFEPGGVAIHAGDWQTYEIAVGRGIHAVKFTDTGVLNCSLYLDAFSVTPISIDLNEATGAPGLAWRTSEEAPWIGQPSASGPGFSGPGSVEAVSGEVMFNEDSWLETTITGPAVFQFSWDSRNFKLFDHFRLFIDGEAVARLDESPGSHIGSWQVGDGEHTLRWVYHQGSSVTHPIASAVVNGFTIVDDFNSWARAHALQDNLTQPNQDADYDGLTNMVEFVLGTNPRLADPEALVFEQTLYGVDISFLELPGHDTGKRVQLQVSPDLVTWSEITTTEGHDPSRPSFIRHHARVTRDAVSTSGVFIRMAVVGN